MVIECDYETGLGLGTVLRKSLNAGSVQFAVIIHTSCLL